MSLRRWGVGGVAVGGLPHVWIFFSGVGVRSLTFPREQFHNSKHGKLLSVLVSCDCRVIEVTRFQSQLEAFFQSDRQIQKTHCRYLHPYGDIMWRICQGQQNLLTHIAAKTGFQSLASCHWYNVQYYKIAQATYYETQPIWHRLRLITTHQTRLFRCFIGL